MTRVVYPDETTRPGVAIRIVQIDSSAETALREFIKKTVLSNEQSLKKSAEDVGKEEASTKKVQKKATSKKKRTSKKKKKSSTTSAA